ncbi:hypothetical protein AW227_08355, partial [Campylobacter jejuni]
MQRIVVLFPLPLGPIITSFSPSLTERLIFFRTDWFRLNCFHFFIPVPLQTSTVPNIILLEVLSGLQASTE